MVEIAEAGVLAGQLKDRCGGRSIVEVCAMASPHSFCWLNQEPSTMEKALKHRRIVDATAFAHFVRLELDDGTDLVCSEDVEIRWFASLSLAGAKHQLLLQLSDGSVLRYVVKLYGFLSHGTMEELKKNHYVRVAIDAIDPRSQAFDYEQFLRQTEMSAAKGSVKQALATQQHIPGLGNGTLQDVLFEAGVSPRRKVALLSEAEKQRLYRALKDVLKAMSTQGGRDGNLDLYGNPGGYVRHMKNERTHCPQCETELIKEAYLGGKVIYCPRCQT